MSHYFKIAVILPSNHGHHELLKVVKAVCNQTVKPAQIVIIDSSDERGNRLTEIKLLCSTNGIQLIYKHRVRALPGLARNIGLGMTQADLIAFIDVQTIPRPNWLESSLNMISSNAEVGVWGATCFSAKTSFERLIRDGFHGVLPQKTLPGSVFKREVFEKAGQFIDWVRAGEDTDWMLRLEVLRIPIGYSSSALVDYVGLIGPDMKQLLRKRYRNYMSSRKLPHFIPQKLLLWLVLYPLIVLIAFNWNYLIAEWRMDSPLYIGHVTKAAAFFPVIIYVVLRGILLPLRRGVGIRQLLPARFIVITLICLVADAVKILVFSVPKRKD